MNPRLAKFRSFCSHVIHKKQALRLSEAEFDECVAFIEDHADLSKDDFVFKVNRWKLDQPKTKHHTDMWSLVLQSAVGVLHET